MSNRPWVTALEMQFSAMRLFGTVEWDKFESAGSAAHTRDMISNLRKATAYHWSAEAVSASVLASRSLPNTTQLTRSNLPETFNEPMWWWFERPLPWLCDSRWGSNLPIAGLLAFFDVEGTLCLATFVSPQSTACFQLSCWWDWGDSIAETINKCREDSKEEVTHLLRFFTAASAWLNQRVYSVSQGQVKRHRFKQLTRGLSASPIQSDVKVIQLRRAEAKPHHPDGALSESVDWSCRWVVNGHWRNQPYKDEHKLIYILPYVKGPDDKPLKVPTHTVYSVSR